MLVYLCVFIVLVFSTFTLAKR